MKIPIAPCHWLKQPHSIIRWQLLMNLAQSSTTNSNTFLKLAYWWKKICNQTKCKLENNVLSQKIISPTAVIEQSVLWDANEEVTHVALFQLLIGSHPKLVVLHDQEWFVSLHGKISTIMCLDIVSHCHRSTISLQFTWQFAPDLVISNSNSYNISTHLVYLQKYQWYKNIGLKNIQWRVKASLLGVNFRF